MQISDLDAAYRQAEEERKHNYFEPIIRYMKFWKKVKAASGQADSQKDSCLRETILKYFCIESRAGQALFQNEAGICGFPLQHAHYEQATLSKAQFLKGYDVQRVCYWLYIMMGEKRLAAWLLRVSADWGPMQDETMHYMYRLRGGYRDPQFSIDLYRRLMTEGFSEELLKEARALANEIKGNVVSGQ